jgi:putative NADH-flavin reductase
VVKTTRLAVVGGAGPLALAAADAFEALRIFDEAGEWTYLSSALVLAPGQRTDTYTPGDDSPARNAVLRRSLRRRTLRRDRAPDRPRATIPS